MSQSDLSARGGMRRLFLSSGSYRTSIVERNAGARLDLARLAGMFDSVLYVFLPTEGDSAIEHSGSIEVREISGNAEGTAAVLGRVGRLHTLERSVEDLVERFRPAVIDVVEPFLQGLIGLRVAQRHGLPLIVHLVSNYGLSYEVSGQKGISGLPYPLVERIERRVVRRADMVLTDRDYYREYALQLGASPERIANTPMWVDPLCYSHEPDPSIWHRLEVPDETPLVYVGRLTREKYPFDLLTALAVARSIDDRRHLVILGGGCEAGALQSRATALGLADFVHIRRGLGREDLQSCLGSAGAVLATHAGYVLLEAALAAAAVVAYDFEWHPQLISDEHTGLLCPYRDAVSMGTRAAELVADRAWAHELGASLRDRAWRRCPPGRAVEVERAVTARLLSPRFASSASAENVEGS